jgi:hypothetical protein
MWLISYDHFPGINPRRWLLKILLERLTRINKGTVGKCPVVGEPIFIVAGTEGSLFHAESCV